MINEKSAMTVWWCKRMYSLTSWALWRKTTSSCRRTVCWQELHTISNHCGWNASWRAWSRCRTPAAETLQCFLRRLLVGLVANIGRGKTGPIEEQAIPSLKLSSSFAVCLFCALSACFMHVFSLLELLTAAVHAVHVSRQCGCHEGLIPKVGTPCGGDPDGHGLATADRQRTIKAIITIDDLFKEPRCVVSES